MATIPVDSSAPYAPPKTVIEVIERYRSQGLPQPLTAEQLVRVSVPESLALRVLGALRLLGLISDDGIVTSDFDGLRRASTPEFKPALIDHLRSVYAEVFTVVDPATASYEQVVDAFRQFKPHGQIVRMVALFLGLLEYAEYSEHLPKARPTTGTARSAPAARQTRPAPKVNGSKSAKRADAPAATPARTLQTAQPAAGHATTVDLGAAGSVTLVVDVNPLLLSKADRDFFFGLVDSIEERRSQQQSSRPDPSDASPDKDWVSTS